MGGPRVPAQESENGRRRAPARRLPGRVGGLAQAAHTGPPRDGRGHAGDARGLRRDVVRAVGLWGRGVVLGVI